ncbi:hypothetical protein AAHA92_18494 [Salvia divinorum]|uniref:Uncharacterized protein n=1 Tax=Salvia divinorum TaxID=28513 RepID=A0ABD1H2A1_SALDI
MALQLNGFRKLSTFTCCQGELSGMVGNLFFLLDFHRHWVHAHDLAKYFNLQPCECCDRFSIRLQKVSANVELTLT